jgi:hypothetical protein
MVSEQNFERLSAYIDRELPPDERTALEERLQREPDLRRELDELRIIVLAVRELPKVQAPRDFTLTPQMVGKTPTSRFLVFPATGLVSVLSSVAAALLLISGGLLLFGSAGQSGGPALAPATAELAMQPTLETSATQQPTVTFTPQIAATMPITLDDAGAAVAGDIDMAEAEEEIQEDDETLEMETEEEAMAESAEEADALFEDDIIEQDADMPAAPAAGAFASEPTMTQEATLGRSAADDAPPTFDDASGLGAVPEMNESIQMTVSASLLPTQQPILAPTRPPVTATPAAIAQAPPSPPRQLSEPYPMLIAGLLLALGVLSAVVALGTTVQRRRNRGCT